MQLMAEADDLSDDGSEDEVIIAAPEAETQPHDWATLPSLLSTPADEPLQLVSRRLSRPLTIYRALVRLELIPTSAPLSIHLLGADGREGRGRRGVDEPLRRQHVLELGSGGDMGGDGVALLDRSLRVVRHHLHARLQDRAALLQLTLPRELHGVELVVAARFAFKNEHHLDEVVKLKHRKGIAKLALRTGHPIVPAYSIGNTAAFSAWFDPFGLLERISRAVQASLFIYWGRFFLPAPKQVRLTYVRGRPLGSWVAKVGRRRGSGHASAARHGRRRRGCGARAAHRDQRPAAARRGARAPLGALCLPSGARGGEPLQQ